MKIWEYPQLKLWVHRSPRLVNDAPRYFVHNTVLWKSNISPDAKVLTFFREKEKCVRGEFFAWDLTLRIFSSISGGFTLLLEKPARFKVHEFTSKKNFASKIRHQNAIFDVLTTNKLSHFY